MENHRCSIRLRIRVRVVESLLEWPEEYTLRQCFSEMSFVPGDFFEIGILSGQLLDWDDHHSQTLVRKQWPGGRTGNLRLRDMASCDET